MKFIRPLSFRRVQAFEKFNYSVLRNSNIIHERCRYIQKWDLGVFIFIEHIRKLTIEFRGLFEIRLSNTLSILPFQGCKNGLDWFLLWCVMQTLKWSWELNVKHALFSKPTLHSSWYFVLDIFSFAWTPTLTPRLTFISKVLFQHYPL